MVTRDLFGERPEEQDKITIRVNMVDVVSLASHHNAYRMLASLRLRHDGDAPLDDLVLKFRSDPPLCEPKEWRIDRLHPNATLEIPQSDLDVKFDGPALRAMTEAVRGDCFFTLEQRRGAGPRLLAELRRDVRFLTRDEWGGISSTPQLIASFVAPNHPAVATILRSASKILKRGGRSGQIDGYHSQSRERVWELGAAIWGAVGELGLHYAVPPASFETAGQKIRSPGRIVSDGHATCLDTALLFAAALEQAGLDPVVVFTRGHAFAGYWLQPGKNSRVLVESDEQIRKYVTLEELLLFETTLATHDSTPSFSSAVDAGAEQLDVEAEKPFETLIDVKNARRQGVTPFAHEASEGASLRAKKRPDAALERAPTGRITGKLRLPAAETRPAKTRVRQWMRRLLDLTRKNALLNMGDGGVELLAPDLNALAAAIASHDRLRFETPESGLGPDDAGRAAESYASAALAQGLLVSPLARAELEKRLIGLHRRARAAFEESGSTIAHIAIGAMRWRDKPKDPVVNEAPILLMPVALHRLGARGRVELSFGAEEIRVNPTLLELLRQTHRVEIERVSQMSQEELLDAEAVLVAMQSGVKDIDGFEVARRVALSAFSFAKVLMWRDLARLEDQMARNRLLRHLIETPREAYEAAKTPPSPASVDALLPASRDFTVLPADSSQKAAVIAASRNADFVLVGPPGSGKSQTIANIIAQNLAENRSVLFVSAKRTALEAVARRLDAAGLSDACLELHSAQTRRSEVLARLAATLATLDARREAADPAASESARGAARRRSERIEKLTSDLAAHADALHREAPSGLTPHAALGVSLKSSAAAAPKLDWTAEPSRARLEETRFLIDRIAATVAALGGVADHPLAIVDGDEWRAAWDADLRATARRLRDALTPLLEARGPAAGALGLEGEALSRSDLDALAVAAGAVLASTETPLAVALSSECDALRERALQLKPTVFLRNRRAEALGGGYRDGVWTRLEPEALLEDWCEATTARWPRRAWLRRRVLRALLGAGAKAPDPENDLPRLGEHKALDAAIAAAAPVEAATFGLFSGAATDYERLVRAFDAAADLRRAIAAWPPLEPALAALTPQLRGAAPLDPKRRAAFDAFVGAYEQFRRDVERFEGLIETAARPEAGSDWLRALVSALDGLFETAPLLADWRRWRRLRADALALDLSPLIDAIEAGALAPKDCAPAFEAALARWAAPLLVDGDPALYGFTRSEHAVAVDALHALLRDAFRDRRDEVLRRRSERTPSRSELAPEPELRLLNREIERRGGGIGLRELLGAIPTLLPRLKPCLLMSPMSVAQYLEVGKNAFDVVIFDEASQLNTWDAVGAIARGRQTVIVGDPNQLPPTNFFDRQEDAGDPGAEDEDDLESILDESVAANLPVIRLDWHYRSEDEALIAFSNHLYYGGGLVTFPSPAASGRPVTLRRVEGRYQRGGGRINPEEAEAVVADLFARLAEDRADGRRRSYGVVTFNVEQQRRIEDLIDARLVEDPSFEFATRGSEPLVVKNLEAIQGDERDVIYFSLTFGPGANGEMPSNFGPLNRVGGERRLNVAVTRARREMRVFASFDAAQLGVSPETPRGVRDLRRFLDFAARGADALGRDEAAGGASRFSAFEEVVAAELGRRGWRVDRSVGLSRFAVSLAVVDPRPAEKGGVPRYLAAVECDGLVWAQAASVADREITRPAMLERLGWRVARAWSIDWWRDPEGAADRLDAELRAFLPEEVDVAALQRRAGFQAVWSAA